MALDLLSRYPGQVAPGIAGFPFGKAQNVVVEGDGTGTPFEQDLVNDNLGMLQALLVEAGLTPSGTPDQVGASQYLEAILRVGGQQRSIREWQPVELPHNSLPRDCRHDFITTPLLGFGQRVVVALGINTATSNTATYARSFDGGVFDADPVGVPATSGAVCAANGAGGEFLFSPDGTADVVRHINLGRTKTTTTFSGSLINALYYAEFCSRYVVFSFKQFYSGATLALAAAAPYIPTGVTGSGAPSVGLANGEFADDGTANIIYAGLVTKASGSRYRIFHSSDAGATWNERLIAGPSATGLNVAWNAAVSKFVAFDSDGNLYTSPTGAAWTLLGTAPFNAASGASTRAGTFAVAGRCVAKILNAALTSPYIAPGIAYTFDLGATWRYHFFGYGFDFTSESDVAENPEPLLALTSANSRFFATDGYRVYRSGLLA